MTLHRHDCNVLGMKKLDTALAVTVALQVILLAALLLIGWRAFW